MQAVQPGYLFTEGAARASAPLDRDVCFAHKVPNKFLLRMAALFEHSMRSTILFAPKEMTDRLTGISGSNTAESCLAIVTCHSNMAIGEHKSESGSCLSCT